MSTMPSGRLKVAPVGQTASQGGIAQCMQSMGRYTLRTFG